MRFLNIVLCARVFAMPVCAQDLSSDKTVLPVDEAAQDPDFFVFRRDLIKAAVERDATFVKSIVAPEIGFSFGLDNETAEEFYKYVDINNPGSPFYNDLLNVLINGGEWKELFNGDGEKYFSAPYTFSTDKITDPFGQFIVINHNVPIFDGPSPSAKVIDRVSYLILKRNFQAEDSAEWPGVFTSKGVPGFISASQVRTAVDHRASFSKDANGQYKMNMFIAGD